MKRFLIRFCIEPRPAAKFLWMDLSLPSTRHMESLHVVQAQHLIDLLHFLQQCFYWCYCFNDLCFTFTRFCSSLGISFEIPSEIWIIHALLHLFLCLSVALLEITIPVGCVIEGLEAGVNSFQLHLWKKSKKNSPFKCLCILKPAVLWIFYQIVQFFDSQLSKQFQITAIVSFFSLRLWNKEPKKKTKTNLIFLKPCFCIHIWLANTFQKGSQKLCLLCDPLPVLKKYKMWVCGHRVGWQENDQSSHKHPAGLIFQQKTLWRTVKLDVHVSLQQTRCAKGITATCRE